MCAELRISASAFTHKGQYYDENTSNIILDGRYLFGYELDNSHVSISSRDRNYFFAICDSKQNDYLNASVSGIKELKKLSSRLKTSPSDIKAKTEMMGECFINTENLLYESMNYSDDDQGRLEKRRPPASPEKKLVSYPEDRVTPIRPGVDDEGGGSYDDREYEGDGSFSENDPDAGPDDGEDKEKKDKEGFDSYDDDYPYQDEEDYEEYDDEGYGYEDGYEYEEDGEYDDGYRNEAILVPGGKGFSTAGIIVCERKISVLAQGDCEAFLLRGTSLRILSSNDKSSGGANSKLQSINARMRSGGMSQGSYGRSSEVFDSKEGDVLLLCSKTVVDALGKENIDEYLAMREDVSIISGTIIHDAVKNDPDQNLTCLVVRVEESYDDDMSIPMSRKVDQRYGQSFRGGQTNGAASALGMAGAAGAGAGAGANAGFGMNTGTNANQGFDTNARTGKTPFQNKDAFSKNSASKFDPPSKRLGTKGINKSMIQSIVTTVILIVLLIVSYYLFDMSRGDSQNSTAGRTTASPKPTQSPGDTTEAPPTTQNSATTTRQTGNSILPDDIFDLETPTPTPEPTPTPTPGPLAHHKVVSGDKLGKIAERYYNSSRREYIELIMRENGLTQADFIQIGQTLIIPQKPAVMPTPEPTETTTQ